MYRDSPNSSMNNLHGSILSDSESISPVSDTGGGEEVDTSSRIHLLCELVQYSQ